jgi:hypothetical protein
MAFNVNDMLSKINTRGGLAKASRFAVFFRNVPSTLDKNSIEDLTFFCESASIPGIAYQTDDIRATGYGNVEKRPYATIYQDVTLNFFCDSDGIVVKTMHTWLQSIFNFNDKSAPDSVTAAGLINNTFGYPKDYFGTVEIIQYTDQKKKFKDIFSVTLEEAYPINIGEIQVDWNSQDTLTKIPVTFTYTYWSSKTLDEGTIDFNSITRANSLATNQSRIDNSLASVREASGILSPLDK